MDKVYIITEETSYKDKNNHYISAEPSVCTVFSSKESCFNAVVDHIQRYFDRLDLYHKGKFEHEYLDWEGHVDRESVVKELDEYLFIEFYNDGFICKSIWIYVRDVYS